MGSVNLSSISAVFKFKTQKTISEKNDSRTRTITDFVGGAGSGKEFAIVVGSEGDFTADTVNTKRGGESLKVTAGASADKIFGTGTVLTRDLTDYVSGRLVFYVDNADNLQSVILYGFTSTGIDSYSVGVPNVKTGWNVYSFNRAEFGSNGSPLGWDSIQRWQFRVLANSNGAVNVSFDSLDFCNPENQESIVSFSFDNCSKTQLNIGIPTLEANGWKCTVFINPAVVGTLGYMTLDDLKGLVSRGHELGAYGYNHTDYATMTIAKMRSDIDKTIDWFIANDLPIPKTLALPDGNTIGVKKESVVKERFNLARGTSNATNYETVDSMPFGYPEHMRSCGMSLGASSINTQVNRLVGNRGIIGLYSHELTELGGSPATAIADFNAIVENVVSKGFEVLSYSQFFDKYPRCIW